ncbi:phytanoyl-CoA dioxygenase family protein [Sphingomonas sp. AOB5]|uniref:phytanoyl-CoA dioxygenase family protein n=1 Tax=Sphingomonas sp. AOB5 TaxID=3034017 RepID=UPI0023F9FC2D|nr:phytanoyl-CoA dioxygenase family protein [Sphingomonas sp. AOB5]MDF7776130.1 phytanoyl-CoA dioxygenase family protein [Sphingomonas sp. AOB5]
MISEDQIARYEADGAIMLPGLFTDWVERLREATERAISNETARSTEGFTRNRDMWMTDPDFRAFVFESPAAELARTMMRSDSARLYFDHLFVKEPGAQAPTPWHQDMPYWPAKGGQVVSIWLALDDVTRETSGLAYVRGSHLGGKSYKPIGFSDGKVSEASVDEHVMPDIDADPGAYEFLDWEMKAGDCLVHNSFAIHGASGNSSLSVRRRALSTRWADADVRFDPRPGTDPVLASAPLAAGELLSGERFPLVIG